MNNRTHLQKVKSSITGSIYLVKGKVDGCVAWFYLAVDKKKIPLFERLHEKDMPSNLNDFGVVLKSGHGETHLLIL